MTTQEWQVKIKKCRKALDKHKELLKECEQEYEDRFGANPSDIDDDFWIDTMHCGLGSVDVHKLIEAAESHIK